MVIYSDTRLTDSTNLNPSKYHL